ncbi:MAG: NAD(+)/NADH kinase [Phycisphaerae bacterium]|nr:NAD(+)/NADH kinase [Phycisphaerae bacterium]
MKNVCLLDNPISGSHIHSGRVADLLALLKDNGFNVTCETLVSLEQTRNIIKSQIETDCELFIVSGGDGTVRSVAQSLIGTGIPLLIFPSGNENLLATKLGLNPEPSEAWKVISKGECKNIDVAQINAMICIAVAGVGVDAAIVHHVHRKRKGHITFFDYVWPTIKTLLSYRHKKIDIRVDGRDVCSCKAFVFIGNITEYGGGLKIFDGAVCDDGLLDMAIFECSNFFQLIYLFFLAATGWKGKSSLIRHFKGKQITISSECKSLKTQIDGDPGPKMPLDIKVVAGGLCLLVP